MPVDALNEAAPVTNAGVTGGGLGARARAAVKTLLGLLPRTRSFNHLHALAYFVYAHGRLPRRDSGLFNDYLFFMKTGDALADPLCQITTDKVYAKYFIDGFVGRKMTPETYAVFDSIDDIRRSDLPDRCVLKPAHGTGRLNIYLTDAATPLSEADYDVLRRGLALDIYKSSRELNYKNLRKRIICEELINTGTNRLEHRVFCYKGVLKYVCVTRYYGNEIRRRHNYYDRDWNRIYVNRFDRGRGDWQDMPEHFPEMREVAETLAQHFECVRVDMYPGADRFWVGELTHCHTTGQARFASIEDERILSAIFFGPGTGVR